LKDPELIELEKKLHEYYFTAIKSAEIINSDITDYPEFDIYKKVTQYFKFKIPMDDILPAELIIRSEKNESNISDNCFL